MLDVWLQQAAFAAGLDWPVSHPAFLFIRVLLAFIVLAALFTLARRYLRPVLAHLLDRLDGKLEQETERDRRKLASHLAHLVPAAVLINSVAPYFNHWPDFVLLVDDALWVYLYLVAGLAFAALTNFVCRIYATLYPASNVPYLGLAQVLKLLDAIVIGILILSTLLGKSPVYLLSGLGALTAVLLLVFKDTILGLVASVQLATNKMVSLGDWIEMPKYGADGSVIEVALTTVKVQNWDNTITTIPTYALIADSFKNWRGMQQSGGRRIKRALKIDIHSIGFLDAQEKQQISQQPELQDFVQSDNAQQLLATTQLTNVRLYRAYAEWLLRQHPKINQNMTLMVRQLESNEVGLPLEIYCFCADKAWVNYEQVQAELFDQLFATLPLFTLSAFQRLGHRSPE
ncbi:MULTISPECIES: mechanosensitive ion channel family protein [Rheinheimera]|uniref:Mechanosensitive ion channel family protein n=1 Tax=Rheinheimera marina TaxID=1774958 RepID=A0ABV9JJ38_9GAMM